MAGWERKTTGERPLTDKHMNSCYWGRYQLVFGSYHNELSLLLKTPKSVLSCDNSLTIDIEMVLSTSQQVGVFCAALSTEPRNKTSVNQ